MSRVLSDSRKAHAESLFWSATQIVVPSVVMPAGPMVLSRADLHEDLAQVTSNVVMVE